MEKGGEGDKDETRREEDGEVMHPRILLPFPTMKSWLKA